MMLADHSGSVYGAPAVCGALAVNQWARWAASPRSGVLSGVWSCLWSWKQASLSGSWVAEMPQV